MARPRRQRAGRSRWLRRRIGLPVHDIAPMRVCRREATARASACEDRRFGYPVELLQRRRGAGWRITEHDVAYHPRAAGTRSKVSGSVAAPSAPPATSPGCCREARGAGGGQGAGRRSGARRGSAPTSATAARPSSPRPRCWTPSRCADAVGASDCRLRAGRRPGRRRRGRRRWPRRARPAGRHRAARRRLRRAARQRPRRRRPATGGPVVQIGMDTPHAAAPGPARRSPRPGGPRQRGARPRRRRRLVGRWPPPTRGWRTAWPACRCRPADTYARTRGRRCGAGSPGRAAAGAARRRHRRRRRWAAAARRHPVRARLAVGSTSWATGPAASAGRGGTVSAAVVGGFPVRGLRRARCAGARLHRDLDGLQRTGPPCAGGPAGPTRATARCSRICAGPTLDIGCGPGRMTERLAAAGRVVLGIDVVPEAVGADPRARRARCYRDVFDPLPGEGAGGPRCSPTATSASAATRSPCSAGCASLLAPGGRVVADCAPPGTGCARAGRAPVVPAG